MMIQRQLFQQLNRFTVRTVSAVCGCQASGGKSIIFEEENIPPPD